MNERKKQRTQTWIGYVEVDIPYDVPADLRDAAHDAIAECNKRLAKQVATDNGTAQEMAAIALHKSGHSACGIARALKRQSKRSN